MNVENSHQMTEPLIKPPQPTAPTSLPDEADDIVLTRVARIVGSAAVPLVPRPAVPLVLTAEAHVSIPTWQQRVSKPDLAAAHVLRPDLAAHLTAARVLRPAEAHVSKPDLAACVSRPAVAAQRYSTENTKWLDFSYAHYSGKCQNYWRPY